ncbi:hypothetical protein BS78_02G083900 [Paspalum vaginatum]|nr:hypothetical protein BS78_02G083900 [Paspalum vaginatum]
MPQPRHTPPPASPHRRRPYPARHGSAACQPRCVPQPRLLLPPAAIRLPRSAPPRAPASAHAAARLTLHRRVTSPPCSLFTTCLAWAWVGRGRAQRWGYGRRSDGAMDVVGGGSRPESRVKSVLIRSEKTRWNLTAPHPPRNPAAPPPRRLALSPTSSAPAASPAPPHPHSLSFPPPPASLHSIHRPLLSHRRPLLSLRAGYLSRPLSSSVAAVSVASAAPPVSGVTRDDGAFGGGPRPAAAHSSRTAPTSIRHPASGPALSSAAEAAS